MAVDDQGMQAIAKAAEEVTPGDKSDYYLKVCAINTPETPVPVEIVNVGDVLNVYDTVTAVPSSTETTIVDYTIPVSKVFRLLFIEASGCNVSHYKAYLDVSEIASQRSYWSDFNVKMPFYDLELSAGDIVSMKVTHTRTSTGDYEARIIGILRDA